MEWDWKGSEDWFFKGLDVTPDEARAKCPEHRALFCDKVRALPRTRACVRADRVQTQTLSRAWAWGAKSHSELSQSVNRSNWRNGLELESFVFFLTYLQVFLLFAMAHKEHRMTMDGLNQCDPPPLRA